MIVYTYAQKLRFPKSYRARVTDYLHWARLLRKIWLTATETDGYGKKVADRYNRRYCYRVTESHKDYYVLENVQKGTSVQISKHDGGIVGIR